MLFGGQSAEHDVSCVTATHVLRAIDTGKCRVDLMRGDEGYKYEWGAVDEPIQRLLIRRTADADSSPMSANP